MKDAATNPHRTWVAPEFLRDFAVPARLSNLLMKKALIVETDRIYAGYLMWRAALTWAAGLAPSSPLGRITLGPYRKCPGVKRRSGAPQRNAGALSIRAFEGSRWGGGAGALMLWVLNVGEGVEGGVAGLVGSGESGRADW